MIYDLIHFAVFVLIELCVMLCEHLHNVEEGASYLSLFCYRPVSLVENVFNDNACFDVSASH